MSDRPFRAVFDCVIFVQALISGRGPSAACFELVKNGSTILFLSSGVLNEIMHVPLRPALTIRYPHLTPSVVESFVQDIRRHSVFVDKVPNVFSLPRDKKDEPYVDLAVAAGADYLVTWNDKHLTYLMRKDTAEGRDFCNRFPHLKIVTPVEFIQELRIRQP